MLQRGFAGFNKPKPLVFSTGEIAFVNVSFLPEPTAALPAAQTPLAASANSTASGEGTVAALLETAENEEQKRRVVQKIFWFGLAVWCFGVPFCLSAFWIENRHLRAVEMASLVGGPQLLRHFALSRTKRQQNATLALLQFPYEPRFLLPLIDFLHTPQTDEVKSQIYPALIEAL